MLHPSWEPGEISWLVPPTFRLPRAQASETPGKMDHLHETLGKEFTEETTVLPRTAGWFGVGKLGLFIMIPNVHEDSKTHSDNSNCAYVRRN